MTKNHRFEIRLAGFGGQGIVTIGKILGTAFSVYSGKNSVNTQSYGPESRGGACRSEVVVSDAKINYPYVRKADLLVALSQTAFDMYIDSLKEDGILIVDPDAVKNVQEEDKRFRLYQVPMAALANEAGNTKCQNSVALGVLCAALEDIISEESLIKALEEAVPEKTVSINLSAFEKGKRYVLSNQNKEN